MLQRRSWKAIAACLALCGFIGINAPAHSQDQPSPQTFNVLPKVPQFSLWNDNPQPGYTLPDGQIMFPHRITMVKLTDAQKLMIGSDLKASVTYYGGCDEFDRIGELVYLSKPKGVAPVPTKITADISKNIPNDISADIPVELGRFITPFSDAWQGAKATSTFPAADLSLYAAALADSTQDVWVGVGGGGNPGYGDGPGTYDPCDAKNHTKGPNDNPLTALDKATGFSYSLDFKSTKPISDAVAYTPYNLHTSVSTSTFPLTGSIPVSFISTGKIKGKLAVILSGHSEEEFTNHTYSVLVNGTEVGTFATQMNCSPYAPSQGKFAMSWTMSNQALRNNWCPGSLVPAPFFDVDIPGDKPVEIVVTRKYLRPASIANDRYFPYVGPTLYQEFPDDLTVYGNSYVSHFDPKYPLNSIDPLTTVTYVDSNCNAVGEDDISVNVLSPTEFTMTPTTSSVTLPPGGDGPVDVLLNPLDSFSQMVNISCSVSSPIKDQKLPLCIVNLSGFQKEPVPYNFSSSLPIMVNKPTAVSLDIVGIVTPLPAPVASIANAEPGAYTVIVTGTATDGTVHNATINVQIQ